MLTLLVVALLSGVTVVSLAWPLGMHATADPVERIAISVMLSLTAVFFGLWFLYICGCSLASVKLAPVAATLAALLCWKSLLRALRDAEVCRLLAAQVALSSWCLGWLALVRSYSGGGWAADWFEHWERTEFFLHHSPLNHQFLGLYALPARPPMINVLTAGILASAGDRFFLYQAFMTLLGTLVLLPAWLLMRHFSKSRGPGIVLLAALALNPLLLQNATFAWTKLPAAFFALTALYCFLRAHDEREHTWATLAGIGFGAGALAHYSIVPYVLVIAGVCAFERRLKLAAIGAAAMALTVLPWFAWSTLCYGPAATLFSNTSVTTAAATFGDQLARVALNLLDTIVPHFLRPLDMSLIAQRDAWGRWHDWTFQLYQLNLLFAFGSVGWLGLAVLLLRAARTAAPSDRTFWVLFVALAIIVGVGVHGGRDEWGLTHICLQPLVLLGLAFLSARYVALERPWQFLLAGGAAIDLVFGIVLHFLAQNGAIAHWATPGGSIESRLSDFSEITQMNFAAKLQHGVSMLHDEAGAPAWAACMTIAAASTVWLARAERGARQIDVSNADVRG